MCSIDGYTGKQDLFTLKDYASFNQDRGPDGTSYFSDNKINIAHSLLKIQGQYTDDQKIVQPYVYGDHVLSYNGEIYGLDTFDTEWLMNAIINEDWSTLKYNTNGMWAFAYYNAQKSRITLARDHFGVKPLYYMVYNGQLYWSSTQKPLIAVLLKNNELSTNIDYDRRNNNNDGFWVSPYTTWNYISRVAPGEILHWEINDDGRVFPLARDTFWGSGWNLDVNYNYDPEEFEELTVKAIKEVSYGPGIKKCLSLSGGLDSSLIASVNRDNDNFMCSTVTYDQNHNSINTSVGRLNEYKKAKKLCKELNIPHSIVTIKSNYNDYLDEVIERCAEQIWLTSRSVPRLLNIKNAYEQGNKIYLVGDMADEIVTGYSGHFWYSVDAMKTYRPGWSAADRHLPNNGIRSDGLSAWFQELGIMETYKWMPDLPTNDPTNKHLFIRTLTSVDAFCGIVDHLAGTFGMESRVPFCHQEWAKYVFKIPSGFKLRTPTNKEMEKLPYKGMMRNRFTRKGEFPHSTKYPEINSAYIGWYKWLFREEMKDWLPTYIRDPIDRKLGFSTPWNARDYSMNNRLRKSELQRSLEIIPKKFAFK